MSLFLTLGYLLLGSVVGWSSPQRAVSVSPGSGQKVSRIETSCPTFSWGAVEETHRYELVMYELTDDPNPVVRKSLPGTVSSWTPSLDQCLEPGRPYAWYVRARDTYGDGEWSAGRYFEVAATPSLREVAGALRVLRSYLRGSLEDEAAGARELEALVESMEGEDSKVEDRGESTDRAGGAPQALAARFFDVGPRGGGVASSSTRSPGVRQLLTPDKTGIRSEVVDTTGVTLGLYGISNSTGEFSAGVAGESTATSGETVGVIGLVASDLGVGVVAENTASSGFAIGLEALVNSAGGIAGAFNNFAGGRLIVASVGSNAVFSVDGNGDINFSGILNGSGLGQSSVNGNFSVGGLLTKSAGSFKIDHPLDPANKYLSHSFVESPDMKNVYDGVRSLDQAGEAWVPLPKWFEALNGDFRYQLTAIGAPMPTLHIAQEISGNRFKISGGLPGRKISWQVTGIRQDAYAQAYRIQVEEEKPELAKGTYLHPGLYGQLEEHRTKLGLEQQRPLQGGHDPDRRAIGSGPP